MDFKYSCFISYRHGHTDWTDRTVTAITEAISEMLDASFSIRVFRDKNRLNGGDFLAPTIPSYFQ